MQKPILRRGLHLLPLLLSLCLFGILMTHSDSASAAAVRGLKLCAQVIIPSLFPFFVLSGLLSALGLPGLLSRVASPLMQKLFSVSGTGAAAFLIGLTGGYPLGAATVAGLYRRQEISEAEAKRLLCFCNNSGPAFIIGAAGSAVFSGAKAGLILYLSHAVSAVLTGLLFSLRSRRRSGHARQATSVSVGNFSAAFPDAVAAAVKSTLMICGYVVFFSVLTGMLDALGVFSSAAGQLAVHSGLTLGQSRAVLTGLLEIGSGISAMIGQSYTPLNMAICAFLLGWGGLSVQFQTRSILSGTPLADAPLAVSKLLHGVLSALLASVLCVIFR